MGSSDLDLYDAAEFNLEILKRRFVAFSTAATWLYAMLDFYMSGFHASVFVCRA